MVLRCLQVHEANGEQIEGTVGISRDQRRATFAPTVAWHGQRYTLRVGPQLEDLSGNTPERAFDDDTSMRTADVAPSAFQLDFVPR
jgi:hypothetical protein